MSNTLGDRHRASVRREDNWHSLIQSEYQRIGVSESHSGHVTREWVPLIQKPIDWMAWFATNWPRVWWRWQRTAFRWLWYAPSRLKALAGGLNLAAWFVGLSWLALEVVDHVG